jgi:very-short-patch-repair endonuclease
MKYNKKAHKNKVEFGKHLIAHKTYHEKLAEESMRSLGIKFRSQIRIGPYFVDFLITDKKAIVEIDGNVHNTIEAICYDSRRTHYLNCAGYSVYRIKNEDICPENLSFIKELPLAITKHYSITPIKPTTKLKKIKPSHQDYLDVWVDNLPKTIRKYKSSLRPAMITTVTDAEGESR